MSGKQRAGPGASSPFGGKYSWIFPALTEMLMALN
jgi:hypothetical protein